VVGNPSIDRLAEVDRLRLGCIHRPPPLVVVPGGKGLNVARSAAALGARPLAVGILAGHAGRWIADELSRHGVEGRFGWSRGETRSCLSVLDRSTGTLTEFYEPGTPASPQEWALCEAAAGSALEEGAGVITMSGSLPPGVPPDGYARICVAARAAGARALLDCHGAQAREALPARPWLLKVNAEEASELASMPVGDPGTGLAAGRALTARGPERVLVTLGVDGAVLLTGEGAWRVSPAPLRGSYPVGSGDAMLGGIATALLDGAGLADAVRAGAAAATANALTPGAGRLDAAEAARVLPHVTLEPIEE
jgi:1-phosphofructokinase family hexose kinase